MESAIREPLAVLNPALIPATRKNLASTHWIQVHPHLDYTGPTMSTIANAPESLFPRLEPLLARVTKPIQYVGGEVNSVVKQWDSTDVRWALMYPDAYEIGQPNQGLAILYEVLNEQDWILAERTYSIWPDLAGLMRQAGVPQFTLDSHRPVASFDVLGVSFSTELGFTNLLEALDLAEIGRAHV